MKKMILFLTVIWLGLNAFANSVKADDYNEAVIGHIIQSKVNGIDVDTQKLLEYEMSKLGPICFRIYSDNSGLFTCHFRWYVS